MKTLLKVLAVPMLMFVGQAAAQTCVQPPSGMVSWWDADSVSGTTAFDLQDGNDGTLLNGVSIVPGIVGDAFSFDGVDDYVLIPSSSGDNLDITSSFTLDAWINYDGDLTKPFYPRIVEKSFATSYFFGLYYRDTSRLSLWINSTSFIAAPGSVSHGQLHHVAAVFDDAANTVNLYVDGSSVHSASYSGSIPGSSNDVLLGKYWADTGGEFSGLIDEVEIFNRALSAAEIQAIYNAGSAGKCKFVEVVIDIKPDSDPNSINLCSNGAVPIAIFGSETFDVYEVDTETLRFAEATVKLVGKKDPHSLCSYEDVDDDIYYDLVCHFLTANIAGIDGESSTATVNGNLLDGTPFEGTDSVNIVKDCN